MQEIAELERRITSALERIGRGVEGMAAALAEAPTTPSDTGSDRGGADRGGASDVARLTEALDEERIANAQLTERLRTLRDRETTGRTALEAEVARLTGLLDAQGLELSRQKKTAVQLREQLRALREAAEQGMADPHLVNKAMLAELEGMRATRSAEIAELDDILAAIDPLLAAPQEEANADA